MVHPDYRSLGIGGQLIEARYDLIQQLNLRGMVAGSLIRDYHAVADQMSAEDYVRDVISGVRFDSNLSKQLRKGFEVHGLIPDYSDAPESVGWGVVIVWQNPAYRPARPYYHPAQTARPAASRSTRTIRQQSRL
ncbi:MAG: hypothetical protein K8I60_11240 [Anaerolineae bacterium]|nr:hypothetical protein [Anaerolineae bacterium]